MMDGFLCSWVRRTFIINISSEVADSITCPSIKAIHFPAKGVMLCDIIFLILMFVFIALLYLKITIQTNTPYASAFAQLLLSQVNLGQVLLL